jgi:hypothetical protein
MARRECALDVVGEIVRLAFSLTMLPLLVNIDRAIRPGPGFLPSSDRFMANS